PLHLEAELPGDLVQVDCFHIGTLSGTKGKVWQYTAIDRRAPACAWAALVCGAFIVSGCLQLTSVLVNQPSKSPTAGHATPTDRLPPLRWLQSARLVRSLLVVVGHVLNEHRAEMALADDQHPVQALAASAAHPPLRMCIGSRSQQWRHHHPGPGRFEDGI